ncbi:MAG TPA: hypothetical protein PL044_00900 [Clostridiales bacterium]|nr:MAG: hypothetical protein BWY37_02003 [Firmicutes bacterium ADurb.Bin262]HOU09378.1 hypothetical protein [Clostridiales bacterium]HQK72326.1 hypothetical protein [Clostridiales bacterium]
MKKTAVKTISLLMMFALVFTCVPLAAGGVSAPAADTAAAGATVRAHNAPAKAERASTVEEALKMLENDAQNADSGRTAASKTAKDGVLTTCGGNCGHAPSIIIHGIGQSETYLLDENGNRKLDKNGKEITAWPFTVDQDALVKTLAGPLVKSLLLQRDCGLSKAAYQAVTDVFHANGSDLNGNPVENIELVRYPSSVARCSEKEKNFIYSSMRLDSYASIAGEDHLYYFAYNSLGNNLQIAQELYDYIQNVKAETGHDKVNIVPVSLGGTIANSLLEYYPEVYDDLNRVVYIIPALDGSAIVGDVYTGNLGLDDQNFYKDLFPSLFDDGDYMGYLINILTRLLPKKVLTAVINSAVQALFDTALNNCTMMWSLVPSYAYPQARQRWLSDDAHAEIRRQTDLYYRAQLDSDENILKLVNRGVDVFDIVDYNQYLYTIAGSWDEVNSDGVIHCDSTSMGATFGMVDTPLPDDYVQAVDDGHNHISPDRIVDASTGLLPDRTFYFRNQHHEGTGRNDVIIKLATQLMVDNSITSVYSMPDRFPQFNVGREARGFMGDVAAAKKIDQSKLSPEDAAELQAAIEQAEATLNNTVVDYEAYKTASDRFYAILIKIGERQPPADNTKQKMICALTKLVSEALYKYYGPRGYSDWLLDRSALHTPLYTQPS